MTWPLAEEGFLECSSLTLRRAHCLLSCIRRLLPVHSSGAFFWFDIYIIVININLRDLNLKMIGQEADGFSNSSQAGAAGWLEKACRGPWEVK